MKKPNTLYWITAVVIILLTATIVYNINYRLFHEYDVRLSKMENLLTKTNIDSITSDDVKIGALKNDLQKLDNDLRKDFVMIINCGLPGTVVAILLFVFGLYRFTNEEVESIKENIKKEVKSEEAMLRDSVVIRYLPENSNFGSLYLAKLGFPNVAPTSIDKVSKDDKVDIYFIDNETKIYADDTHEDIKKIIQNLPEKAMLFGYNLNFKEFDSTKRSSATFRSQIYTNLMSLIRYQDLYKKIKSE